MAKISSPPKGGTHFSVSSKSSRDGVFREITSGKFSARVMNKGVYDRASASANNVIREYVTKKK
ncbi:MAG: hypothetical protein IT534_02555 [Bauldia sp.]|nr:hypothetical protein [Bauldia sp.]